MVGRIGRFVMVTPGFSSRITSWKTGVVVLMFTGVTRGVEGIKTGVAIEDVVGSTGGDCVGLCS